jgi:hypothetical protein
MRFKFILLLTFCSFVLFGGRPHKTTSVLATGNWWKLSVGNTGIHKISYQDLVDMNMDPEHIDPSKIRLFGNGTGMLPELNSSPRFDDLREIPVKIISGDVQKLHPGDYILFYGESPDSWTYDYVAKLFWHKKNLYSKCTYYFLTVGTDPGKRVLQAPDIDSVPTYYSKRYIDYSLHEIDSLNLIKSGKLWVGEEFNYKCSIYNIPFSFPNIDPTSILHIVTSAVAKAPQVSKFFLSVNGALKDSIQVELTDPLNLNIYATSKKRTSNIPNPSSTGQITLDYHLPTTSSLGWLDYIEINCQRNLIFAGTQMSFRDPSSVGANRITEFLIKNTNSHEQIWDVTFPGDIQQIIPVSTDSTMKFKVKTDTLREFITFDSSFYFPVKLIGPVTCQNLHSSQSATLVIVSHPKFMNEAERLATFHREHNNISVLVANVDDIYNEFSCGQNDITGIRDFMKMLYDQGYPGNEPKYLLLFGDGTYDPKDRLPGNNNYIPTYQSVESLRPLGTYVTDDYYGIMADNAGADANGNIYIGIGRFPVSTEEQARSMVDKIIRYSSSSDTVLSEWRNTITFIADDENLNLHMHQAEQLAKIVNDKFPVFNVNKIYLDAYKMIQTPVGARLPEVNDAIGKAVSAGTVILNYTGHGGEDGWASEKVLTVADINNWKNSDKLPVFVTATCEFSRFDNPERVTGGEMVILNPLGGAIALYSTTRLALATANFKLDTSFFKHLIAGNGNPNPKLGDLIRISKNMNGNNGNVRNFVLLGDPAQSIAFPANWVSTTVINQKEIDSQPDTVLGLMKVTVKGEIEDGLGVKMNTFNGTVLPKVFDKPVVNRTLGNTSGSYPENYALQNSILYQGRSTVKNGEFEFNFVIPKGISLQFGKGKISYYAQNGVEDANGYYNNLIIGGVDPTIDPQNSGPDIDLFFDSTNFSSGQRTGKNTVLLVFLQDPDGINAFYLGIGHEIVATLDNDDSHAIILNDNYQPTFDKFGSGTIQYQFTDLSNGFHSLRLKAWDLYDNSSTQDIGFFVFDRPTLSVNNLTNVPNPVRDHTIFTFIPTRNYGILDVQIQIYSSTGILVKTLENNFQEESISLITIPWDGTGENHQQLPEGLYIYRLVAKGSNGAYTTTSQKLMISH